MKKLLLSVAAASALLGAAAAAPAMADPYDGYGRHDRGDYGDRYDRDGGYGGIDMRQSRIEHRIDRGLRTGRLSPREARRLEGQARDIARLEARYRWDGLNGFERADLNRRLDYLEARLNRELRDGDAYGYGYGPGYGGPAW
jgi:opacity protein-like surface antigen